MTTPGALDAPATLIDLLVDVSDWAGPGATPDPAAARELRELLGQVRPGLRVEPVYLDSLDGAPRYRKARNAVGRLLGLGWPPQDEPVVDVHAGDIYYADAASPTVTAARGARADRLLCASAAIARQLALGREPDRL